MQEFELPLERKMGKKSAEDIDNGLAHAIHHHCQCHPCLAVKGHSP